MLSSLLRSKETTLPLAGDAATALGGGIAEATGWEPYPQSLVAARGVVFFLGRHGGERRLCLLWKEGSAPDLLPDFCGERMSADAEGVRLAGQAGYLDHTNAVGLRKHLTFTAPSPVGVRAAFGAGDRLGLATPAHVRAVRGSGLVPLFAQQSIREMSRTGRTPEEVMDTATFGVFQEGWREGFGADADHLKTTEHIDATVAVGFTMFTIDPGDHVDNDAEGAEPAALQVAFDGLPCAQLESTPEDLRKAYVGRSIHLPDDSVISFDQEALLRAAVKYGRALAYTAMMYRHLCEKMGSRPFELEMSVDETESPTSVAEHAFVAMELKRLGVQWVGLAPRFVGRFEKGVDYIGELGEFERSFAGHVAVAREFGPYKISIHSGSDKFSIYPIAARLAGELVHLKTAGTSYLEAVRAIARVEPTLFREILGLAIERYPEDRASYHVSADLSQVRGPESLADGDLPAVLDHFHTREVVHVTFGSVLARFGDRLMQVLADNEETHYETVHAHIARHIGPFAGAR
jgi:hypothetical protein